MVSRLGVPRWVSALSLVVGALVWQAVVDQSPVSASTSCSAGSVATTTELGYIYRDGRELANSAINSYRNVYRLKHVSFSAGDGVDGVCTWVAPAGVRLAQVFAVGGGGAGGTKAGGGGGGGGVFLKKAVPFVAGQTYDVVVGAGGQPSSGTCTTSCAGGDGHVSTVKLGSDVVAAAGGGGGGGGNRQAGRIGVCTGMFSCGGGGGGAAPFVEEPGTYAGGSASWPEIQVSQSLQRVEAGGAGRAGTSTGGLRFEGGGGGGGATTAGTYIVEGEYGASGVYFETPLTLSPFTYGAGGGTVYAYYNNFTGGYGDNFGNMWSYGSSANVTTWGTNNANPAGGRGAKSSTTYQDVIIDLDTGEFETRETTILTDATAGRAKFGGGGGGGGFPKSNTRLNSETVLGGAGGSGTVDIYYLDIPQVSGGVTTLSHTYGQVATSTAFTATGGNYALNENTYLSDTPSHTWSITTTAGASIPGVTINSSGVVSVASSVQIGTINAVVKATDPAGTVGTKSIAITTVGAAQSVSFSSTPPGNVRAGEDTYTVFLSGASTNTYNVSIASGSSSVCSISGSTNGSTVSFDNAGTCVINAYATGDGTRYLDSPVVSQSVTVSTKDAQEPLVVRESSVGQANLGDTRTIYYSGGSGTGAFSLTIAGSSSAICTVSGNVITTIGLGFCNYTVSRAGDRDFLPATPYSWNFQVVSGRTVALNTPGSWVVEYSGSTVVQGVTANVSAGLPFSVNFTVAAGVTNCSFGHPSRYDLGFTGTGLCKVFVEENDNTYSYTRSPDYTFYVVAAGDSTGPTVTGVSAPGFSGRFESGKTIDIQVKFSERVRVIGTPRIQLETGATDRWANYVSGDYEDTLVFRYTVQSGDTSSQLDYVSTSALSGNGGNITDLSSNQATFTLPTPGSAGSLAANTSLAIGAAPTTTTTTTSSTTSTTSTSTTVAPDPATTPVLGLDSRMSNGFKFSIRNYDADYTYTFSPPGGVTAAWAVRSLGLVSVTGLSQASSATVTVTGSIGDQSASASITGSSLDAARTPVFGTPTPARNGFVVVISNHDAAWSYVVSSGSAVISGDSITVTNLDHSATGSVTIHAFRDGYEAGYATITGTALPAPPPTTTTTTIAVRRFLPTTTVPSQSTTPPQSTTSLSAPTTTVPGLALSTAPTSGGVPLKLWTLRKGSRSSGTVLAKKFGLSVPKGARVSVSAATSSRKVCTVINSVLTAKATGSCRLTISIILKTGKRTNKSYAVTVN